MNPNRYSPSRLPCPICKGYATERIAGLRLYCLDCKENKAITEPEEAIKQILRSHLPKSILFQIVRDVFKGIKNKRIVKKYRISPSVLVRTKRKLADHSEEISRHLGESKKQKLEKFARVLIPEFYPYMLSQSRAVHFSNRIVPENIPESIRPDVCQDVAIALLEGDIDPDSATLSSVRSYINENFAKFQNKYGFMSLDAPIRGHEDLSIKDMLERESFPVSLKRMYPLFVEAWVLERGYRYGPTWKRTRKPAKAHALKTHVFCLKR